MHAYKYALDYWILLVRAREVLNGNLHRDVAQGTWPHTEGGEATQGMVGEKSWRILNFRKQTAGADMTDSRGEKEAVDGSGGRQRVAGFDSIMMKLGIRNI